MRTCWMTFVIILFLIYLCSHAPIIITMKPGWIHQGEWNGW